MILILFSCNEKKEKKETESRSEAIIESKTESELDNDYSKSAYLFAQEVLNDNFRIHSFDLSNSLSPKYLRIFQSDGLEKIEAYSNKKYPKNSEPIYYEHFTLFIATYKNSLNAKNSFEQIKSDSKYGISDNLENLDKKQLDRVQSLIIGIKPGGLITQKGKQVFSLVETCKENPLGGNWIDYENKFLEFITNTEIEVLNSDCGKMINYKIEKRKSAGNKA